jgi:hypothetical protein
MWAERRIAECLTWALHGQIKTAHKHTNARFQRPGYEVQTSHQGEVTSRFRRMSRHTFTVNAADGQKVKAHRPSYGPG